MVIYAKTDKGGIVVTLNWRQRGGLIGVKCQFEVKNVPVWRCDLIMNLTVDLNWFGGAKHGNRRMGFFRLFERANWTIRKMRDGSEILPRSWSGIRRF